MSGLTWGTYGKNGDEQLFFKPIESLSTNHIINIIRTQHLSDRMLTAFCNILLERNERNKKFKGDKWKYKTNIKQ